jgi:pimeloyl-ACP methyl ester carboxylesterase
MVLRTTVAFRVCATVAGAVAMAVVYGVDDGALIAVLMLVMGIPVLTVAPDCATPAPVRAALMPDRRGRRDRGGDRLRRHRGRGEFGADTTKRSRALCCWPSRACSPASRPGASSVMSCTTYLEAATPSRGARLPGAAGASLAAKRTLIGLRGQHALVLGEFGPLPMPTLIVCGARDRMLPSRHADAGAARLARGEVVIIPNCGHLPHIEQAGDFVSVVSAFLAQAAEDRNRHPDSE